MDRIAPEGVPSSTEPIALFSKIYAYEERSNWKENAQAQRVYGEPSQARLQFNKAFEEFRALQTFESDESAFAKTKDKFSAAISSADESTERSQQVFFENLDNASMKDGKALPSVIESLQLLSAALTSVPPYDRHKLMNGLAKGDDSGLKDFPDLKARVDGLPESMARNGKSALLKSWFDYRADIGDSIGQRQVYIGLCERFGSPQEARSEEKKVEELKNKVGGKFLFERP